MNTATNTLSDYYQDGYVCRLGGAPLEACPYELNGGRTPGASDRPYLEWEEGWYAAHKIRGCPPLRFDAKECQNITTRKGVLTLARRAGELKL